MSQLLQDVLSGDRRRHPLHPLQDPQREQQRREVLVLLQEPEVPGGVLEAPPELELPYVPTRFLGFSGHIQTIIQVWIFIYIKQFF